MSRISSATDALTALASCFATRSSVYVLGAGVSAPYVPTNGELSEEILEPFFEYGVFAPHELEPDAVTARVVTARKLDLEPLERRLVDRVPPGYVRSKLIDLFTPELAEPPTQYAVFNRAAKPATILSMNVDGLAGRFCDGHYVVEPHGRTPGPQALREKRWADVVEKTLTSPGLPAPAVPGLLLPQPEPPGITHRPEYRRVLPRLRRADGVAVIGYSFGSMDDEETYSFLVSNITAKHCSIVVISHEPYEVMQMLADALKSRKVTAMAADWQALSKAIMHPLDCRKYHPPARGPFCVPCTLYGHECLLDRR